MQFGNLTFSHGDNRDALKPHLLKEGRDMFLIAADTVETFGYDDIEHVASSFLQQPLISGTQMGRSAQSPVGIGLGLLPVVAIDQA